MTPFLLPSNPTDTKTMRVSWALLLYPTCYFRAPWLADYDAFAERVPSPVQKDLKPFTCYLSHYRSFVINLYIYTYRQYIVKLTFAVILSSAALFMDSCFSELHGFKVRMSFYSKYIFIGKISNKKCFTFIKIYMYRVEKVWGTEFVYIGLEGVINHTFLPTLADSE